MITLTISSASKPPPFARGFPLSIQVSDDATVADVKTSIAAKFPKVSCILGFILGVVWFVLLRVFDTPDA